MNRSISKEQAYGEIERIFRTLLPQNGLAVREEQIALCYAMMDKRNKVLRYIRFSKKTIRARKNDAG